MYTCTMVKSAKLSLHQSRRSLTNLFHQLRPIATYTRRSPTKLSYVNIHPIKEKPSAFSRRNLQQFTAQKKRTSHFLIYSLFPNPNLQNLHPSPIPPLTRHTLHPRWPVLFSGRRRATRIAMRLGPRKPSSRQESTRSASSSLASIPSLSRSRRSFKSKDMETFVTLNFLRRDSQRNGESADGNDVQMSNAGQRIIPATFKLVPFESQKDAVTDSEVEKEDSFDQAGGHDGSFRSDGGILVKKVEEREAAFYELAEEGQWPAGMLPKFYGRTDDGQAIKIENLTYGFRRPCVMDLKMGVQTVEDDESSLIKKLKMTALDVVTRTKSAGVRLEGLSMYRTLENKRIKGTKAQSHSISAHVRVSLQDVLMFFLTDETGIRTDLALRFETAIKSILEQFEKNDKFRFIGSSILLIYDNDNRAPHMHWFRALRKLHTIAPNVRLSDDQILGLTRRTKCNVRMIDFAHTGPMPKDMKSDEGYITGLNTILGALCKIRQNREKPIFEFKNAVVDVMEEQRALSLSAKEKAHPSASTDKDFTFDTLLSQFTPLALGQVTSEPEKQKGGGGESQLP